MQLPELLNNKVWQELETIEEREKMQYITSVERIGMARGEARILKRLLEHRFGVLPANADRAGFHSPRAEL